MRILHVDPERSFGGGERQVAGLIRSLAARGHENVLAAPAEGLLATVVAATDARVVPLRIRNDADVLAGLRLRALANREGPDVIHLHTGRAHAMSPWLGSWRPRSLVTRRMDYPIRPGLRTHLLYDCWVGGVVAISAEVRRRLIEGGVDPQRIHLIHSSIEPPSALPGPTGREAARRSFGADGRPLVGIVAALERRKGHDVLFRSLDLLRRRGRRILCVVCGDGSQRLPLERLVASLGLHEDVRFLGERRQVADVLAALDVFVLPSRYEGLGVAALEAMGFGLPVVASGVGGLPEVVENGVTGLLVRPDRFEELADAIDALVGDPERARDMGRRARDRILERFTLDRMTDAYEAVYAHVAGFRPNENSLGSGGDDDAWKPTSTSS